MTVNTPPKSLHGPWNKVAMLVLFLAYAAPSIPTAIAEPAAASLPQQNDAPVTPVPMIAGDRIPTDTPSNLDALSPAAGTPTAKTTADPASKDGAANSAAKTADESTALIGEVQTITTKYEDTLVHLARKYNVGFVEIRAANPNVDPWLPGAGTRVIIPSQHLLPDAPHRGVVINLSEMRLYHYQTPGEPPVTYPIGIGRSGLTTPLGTSSVARKTVDPIWYPTERMRREDPTLPAVVPPGPENPMGTHAMYLAWDSYAIHGTDKPYSIGRRLSSGCIRMYPEDIITLFDRVPTGTPVTVVDQPIKAAWIGDKFYIEVHPTQEQSDILSHDTAVQPDYQMSERDMRLVLKTAGEGANTLDWGKIRQAMKTRTGIPVVVATRGTIKSSPLKDEDLNKQEGAITPPATAHDRAETSAKNDKDKKVAQGKEPAANGAVPKPRRYPD